MYDKEIYRQDFNRECGVKYIDRISKMVLLINTLLSNILRYFKCRKLVHAQQSIGSQSS